jgi:hypothetical protein
MSCNHEHFEADVIVNRFAGKDPMQFAAEISIRCTECGLPFHFIGFERGLSFHQPLINLDGTELRLPILPGSLALEKSGSMKYEM